mmetsp:Transcript_15645/g.23126  ORF Transcript_15645/g.23126 Transcript_15645/m.23126 type:complete len:96 (+) Transcript_15645:1151-1438(+)
MKSLQREKIPLREREGGQERIAVPMKIAKLQAKKQAIKKSQEKESGSNEHEIDVKADVKTRESSNRQSTRRSSRGKKICYQDVSESDVDMEDDNE